MNNVLRELRKRGCNPLESLELRQLFCDYNPSAENLTVTEFFDYYQEWLQAESSAENENGLFVLFPDENGNDGYYLRTDFTDSLKSFGVNMAALKDLYEGFKNMIFSRD